MLPRNSRIIKKQVAELGNYEKVIQMAKQRKGLGKGQGTGFKNIIPGQDSRTHSNSSRGIKQPQFSSEKFAQVSRQVEQRIEEARKVIEQRKLDVERRKEELKVKKELKAHEKAELEELRAELRELRDLSESEFSKKAKEIASKTGVFIAKEAKIVGKKALEIGKVAGREALEFARAKLKAEKEKKAMQKIKLLEEIDHPVARKIDTQQTRVAEIKEQIALNEDEPREDKLFDELRVEENQLRGLQEKATSLQLQELTKPELKTLAVRYQPVGVGGFLSDFVGIGDENPYQTELVRRIKKQKEIEKQVVEARKQSAKPEPGFFEDFFSP